MTALAAGRILGSRSADGRVHVPPAEYDPVTFAPPAELVQVGPAGTVLTWSWQPEPIDGQPLDRPFAWALIRLGGATGGPHPGHRVLRAPTGWRAATARGSAGGCR